jgi:hypothetical protein
MRKALVTATALVALLAPAAAGAQLDLGVRVGWAVPAGHAFSGGDLAGLVNGALPVQIDVGYRLSPALSVGAFASYALGRIDAHVVADAGVDHGATVLRAGLRASYALERLSPVVVPWAGLGAGYERMRLDLGTTYTYLGWELVTLEAGADWKVRSSFRIGPVFAWSLGGYDRLEIHPDPDGSSGGIAARGRHAWVTLGLRGRFLP